MGSAPRSMTARDWALLVVLGVLWSGSYFFVALAVRDVPPLTLVFVRTSLGAAALAAVARASGLPLPVGRREWAALALGGFLNCALPFTLLFWSQRHIASSLAAILISTGPLLTIICAHFMTPDERLNGRKLAGVTLGLLGVAVLIGIDALRDFGVQSLAQLGVLAAALCYALAAVVSRQFARQPPIVTAVGQLVASAVIVLPLALIVDQPWGLPPPGHVALVAAAGLTVFSTAVAYIIYFEILRSAGASNVMLVSFLTPVGASLLGVLVLGESLAPHNLVGMALILAGLAIIDGRALAALRQDVR